MSTDVNSPGSAAVIPDDLPLLKQLLEKARAALAERAATLSESGATIAAQHRAIEH